MQHILESLIAARKLGGIEIFEASHLVGVRSSNYGSYAASKGKLSHTNGIVIVLGTIVDTGENVDVYIKHVIIPFTLFFQERD